MSSNDPPRVFPETSGATLPSDLTGEATRRLAVATLLFALSFVLAWIVAPAEVRSHDAFPMLDVAAVGAVAASAVVFVLTYALKRNRAVLFDVGLIYEVVFCAAIALSEQWVPWDFSHAPRGISWVCLVLVVFPLTVPCTPGKTLLAALAGASTGPLALLIAAAKGNPLPKSEFAFAMFLPNYLAAGGAYVLSRIIYKLGKDVTDARQLGSYQLIERLGGGGMGEVWRAKHRLLSRPAAVKFVRPKLLAQDRGIEARRRFEHEAQVTSSLESPHTVSVFDYGTTQDGTFYYVMELLEGLDLQSLVKRFGRVPPERVVHILRQVCKSLAEAHDRGMIHRDIKPANIHLCHLGIEYDFVKVLDFGLVITDPSAENQLTRLTAQGMTSGTPQYMAPEMADAANRVDARADLYALGCVGYWMLTGELVFDAASSVKVLADHLHTRPSRPSERIGDAMPADLEDVIMRCLEKEPSLRPQNARELDGLLEACECAEDWTPARAERWWRENLPGGRSAPSA